MASSNRADRFDHLYKALRKHYKPIVDPTDRRVLDCLLYACCLEDASHEAADEAFAKLQQTYFDANEIRVTTIAELSESLTSLPKAAAAAGRLKKSLQSLFEARYSFDIDDLKKANLGKAVEEVAAWEGTSKFVMGYVTQHAFGGHSIPVDNQILSVCVALELLTTTEASKGVLPGIERAIPKNKGLEFASLLHQFAVEYTTDFHHPIVNAIFKEMGVANKVRVSFVAPLPVKETEKAPLAGTAQHLEATNAKAKAEKQAAAAVLEASAPPAPKTPTKTASKQDSPVASATKPTKMAAVNSNIKTLTPKEAAQKEKASEKTSGKKPVAADPKPTKKGDTKAGDEKVAAKGDTKAAGKPADKNAKANQSTKASAAAKSSDLKAADQKATAKKAPAAKSPAKPADAKTKTAKPAPTTKSIKPAPAKSTAAKPTPSKPTSTDKSKKNADPPKSAAPASKKGTAAKQLPVKAVTKKNTKPR
jgi:endonuclease III